MNAAILAPIATPASGERQADIERTAEEISRSPAYIRAAYIRKKVGDDTSFKWRALHYANASDLDSDTFRQLFTDLAYADDDGGNSFQSNETSAKLTGRSLSNVERANSTLAREGWRVTTKRRRKLPAIKKIVIPQKALDANLFELLEPSPVTVQDFRTFARDGSRF